MAYSDGSDVAEHFPPTYIVGKEVGTEQKELLSQEDDLVKVTVSEVVCEFNFSNPTGWFNTSLPHVELRTNNYSTVSYAQN